MGVGDYVAENRGKGKMTGDRITLCSGCKPGEGPAMEADLRTRLAKAGAGTAVALVDCMLVCGKPVTVSFRATGKTAYLFAGVDPVGQGANLVAFARLYAAAPDGMIADVRPAGDLRLQLIGRIPA